MQPLPSTLGGTKLTLSTGTAQPLTIGGAAGTLAMLGLTAGTTQLTPPALSGQTLTIGATGGGTATNITFGTGTSQVSTLNGLNAALAANNLQATHRHDRQDQYRDHERCGVVDDRRDRRHGNWRCSAGSGAGAARSPIRTRRPPAPAWSRSTTTSSRRSTPPSQDASFNGINLLNGDTLKLMFNETGKSTLNITGVTFNAAGLGLSTLTAGTDFLDNTRPTRCCTR